MLIDVLVAALAAQHLVGHHVLVLVRDGQQLPVVCLYLLGEAVRVHRAGEGGPRGVVLVLLRAGTDTNIKLTIDLIDLYCLMLFQ